MVLSLTADNQAQDSSSYYPAEAFHHLIQRTLPEAGLKVDVEVWVDPTVERLGQD